jgi:hypothetical protein
MASNKFKRLAIIGLLVLPILKQSTNMENKVVIGKVIVPQRSIEEFKRQNTTHIFLSGLPGFIKGDSYERLDESGNLIYISVTTWLDQEAYEHAEQSLKEHYKSTNFDVMAYRERLKIVAERGLYTRNDQ